MHRPVEKHATISLFSVPIGCLTLVLTVRERLMTHSQTIVLLFIGHLTLIQIILGEGQVYKQC